MKIRIPKVILVLLCFLVAGISVRADDPFLPLSAVRPGMTGYGLTVFAGTKVESFPVEVVGVLEGSGSVAHLILISFTGGQTLAAGMSGSPVFVGDKLIGAIGYGFNSSDHGYALVTPIEEMLTLWSRKEAETFSFIGGGLAGFDGVTLGETPANGNWLRAFPVTAPLFLSGYGPRAHQYLLKVFERQGAFTLPQGGGRAFPTSLPLAAVAPKAKARASAAAPQWQPGSALTVTLVEGDYKVTALGTLTWLDGQKFLGFGHPFLNRGKVDFGMGGAEILGVIDNQDLPFKIGVAFPYRGRITQDRGAGLAGEFGVMPKMVEVTAEVTDEESGLVRSFAFAVVNEENLLPNLVLAGVIDTIDRTLDLIGSGTANVYFELAGDNFALFQRENLFCGPDVAVAAVQELGELLRVLTGNEFVHPGLTSVKVRVKVNPELLWARIIEVELPKKEFAPGEKAILTVHLHPYRGEVVQMPLEVELPSTPGKWVLMVYGNDYDYVSGEEGNTEEEMYNLDLYQSGASLEERLADYRTRIKNNQLVVGFLPSAGLEGAESSATPVEGAEAVADEAGEDYSYGEQTVDTSYLIVGEEQIEVEVLPVTGDETPTRLKDEFARRLEVDEW
ncbi:MAG: hypothetical protein GX202_00550 [Firmicutes bacterium]|nr:hypothetical protein [Bacillota bacterium]